MFQEIENWQRMRCGKITASEIYKIMKSGKSKDQYFGDTARTYLDQKIAEIMTGVPASDLSGVKAIEWGYAHEFEAAQEYELRTGRKVEYFGSGNPKFVPFNAFSGASPDGLADDRTIEIKCPYTSATHARNLIASLSGEGNAWMKKERTEYYYQVQFQMLCLKKDQSDFVSYDPRPINPHHRLAIIHMQASQEDQAEIKERLEKAGAEVEKVIELLFNEK